MSIVVTELELNQYKKDFKSCQKLWKQNTIHISSLQLIQWTHWKTKNWLNFFHPSQPWKTIPSFIPNISLGWIWKKKIKQQFVTFFILSLSCTNTLIIKPIGTHYITWTHTIRQVKFLSKNSILTKLQHFHEFLPKNFFDNFSREIKVVNSQKV